MKHPLAVLALAACCAGAVPIAAAQMKHDSRGTAQGMQAHEATGKVTKVDRSAGRVTIAHGPVASLKWPAMTMPFEVKDKALLDKAKEGQTIQFSFVESGRKYIVTAIK